MAKRHHWNRNYVLPEEVSHAVNTALTAFQQREIDIMLDWKWSVSDLLTAMFDVDTLEKLRSASDLCAFDHNLVVYYASYVLEAGCTLRFSSKGWKAIGILPPKANLLTEGRPDGFSDFLSAVNDIRIKYAKVIKVFDWFNSRNVAPAAVDYYCPWVRSLVSKEYHKFLNGRFRNPSNLADILVLSREVTPLVASMLLLPALKTEKGAPHINLTFDRTNALPALNLSFAPPTT